MFRFNIGDRVYYYGQLYEVASRRNVNGPVYGIIRVSDNNYYDAVPETFLTKERVK